jgi:O-antigen ligase
LNFANKTIFFLICACVVMSTLAYGTVHQPTLAVFYGVVAVMVVAWAVDGFRSETLRYSQHPIQLPLYAGAIYAFIQIIPFGSIAEIAGLPGIPRTISAAPFDTETTALHFVALAFFLSLVLIYLDTAERLRRMVTLIAIFGFVFAFFAILQSVLSPTKIYGIFERATPFGSFVNRHNYAAYMEMAMAIPLGMMFSGAVARDKKLLYVTAITLMGTSLLLSGSRGGLMAMVAEIILLVILTTRTRGGKAIALKIALSLLLAGAVIAGAVFVGGETSFTRFAETAASKDITTNRTHIWSITTRVITANLPFGAGLGAFGQAYTPFDDYNGLERVEQAHNDYLQVLADAGIVGAAIGGLFLFMLIREARKNGSVGNAFRRGVAIGSIAGIFAVLVHSLFDFVLHTTAVSILFLTLVGMLVAAGREYPDDSEDEQEQRSKRRRDSSVTTFNRKN